MYKFEVRQEVFVLSLQIEDIVSFTRNVLIDLHTVCHLQKSKQYEEQHSICVYVLVSVGETEGINSKQLLSHRMLCWYHEILFQTTHSTCDLNHEDREICL